MGMPNRMRNGGFFGSPFRPKVEKPEPVEKGIISVPRSIGVRHEELG
jgi:hypothetical protein